MIKSLEVVEIKPKNSQSRANLVNHLSITIVQPSTVFWERPHLLCRGKTIHQITQVTLTSNAYLVMDVVKQVSTNTGPRSAAGFLI